MTDTMASLCTIGCIAAGFAILYGLGYMSHRIIVKIFGPSPESFGPLIAVYLQKGDARGWLRSIRPDGTPELTTDVWERKVERLLAVDSTRQKTLEEDLYLLYTGGWVICVQGHCNMQPRFEARRKKELKEKPNKEK